MDGTGRNATGYDIIMVIHEKKRRKRERSQNGAKNDRAAYAACQQASRRNQPHSLCWNHSPLPRGG